MSHSVPACSKLSESRTQLLLRVVVWSTLVCGSRAWLCNLNMTASSPGAPGSVGITLSCRPTDNAEAASSGLVVWVDHRLRNGSFTGCQPRFAEAGLDGLVQFEDTTNFTLANSSIVGINAAKSSNILNFVNTSRITVTDFSSRECNVSGFVLAFDNYNAYEADSLVTVEASQFSDSAAGSIGIFNHSASIRDSTFNSISVYGHLSSTIWHVNQDDSRLEVSNCSFTNLVNNNGVPAIHVARADMYISTSSFINCTAGFAVVHIDNDPLLNGSYNSNETVTVESSVFANCNASNGNSVLYHLGKDLTPHQQLNVYNSVFRNNIAAIGGAVTVLAVGFAEVVGCTFEENASLGGLGALYAYGWPEQVTYITLRDTVFTRNNGTRTELVAGVAGATDSAQAAGAYLSNCQCTAVVNSSFQHNLGIGLAVHGHGASQGYCEMQGSAVDQFNRSTILDGVNGTDIIADFLGQWGAMDMGLAIHDSAFVSNTASSLVRLAQDEIQVEDANTGGAGLDINNVYFSVITGSVFASNRGRQGSGMHLDTIFASLVWNSTFTNNTATSEGGALALVNSHNTGLLVANSTIQTSLGVHGGAIYGASGASVNVSFNSLVTDNQAIANGGALYCDGCQAASMQLQSNFSRNQAGQSGGACYCTGCVVMTVDSAYLGNNRAGSGGAVAVLGTGVTLTQTSNSTFHSNLATAVSPITGTGGAVSFAGGVHLLSDNTFISNTATATGGAVQYTYACAVVNTIPGAVAEGYLWTELGNNTQLAAKLAGSCSYLNSTADTFLTNHAGIAGAVLYSNNITTADITCLGSSQMQPNRVDCPAWESAGNTVGSISNVGYGVGLASAPANIVLGTPGSGQLRYISDGTLKLPVVEVHVLDQAGHLVTPGVSRSQPLVADVTVSNMSLLPPSASPPQLPGQTQATADVLGNIQLNGVVLLAAPGLYRLSVALPAFPQVPAAWLEVTVQECGIGQIPVTPNQCSLCPPVSYSFDPTASTCKACPAGATCSGGATLVPQQGYWHSAPDSDHMVSCPNSNACQGNTAFLLACQNATYSAGITLNQNMPVPACIVSNSMYSTAEYSYQRQLCTEGYYGPACSMCIRDGPQRYGRAGFLQCKACPSKARVIGAYVGCTILVLLWLSFIINVTLAENEEVAAGSTDPGHTTQLIRGLNMWLQYLTLLGQANLPVPHSVQSIFNVASLVFASVTSLSLPLDCAIAKSKMNTALQRILVHLALPALVLLLLMCIQVIRLFLKHPKSIALPSTTPSTPPSASLATNPRQPHDRHAELRRRLKITLLEVTFYYYPSLLTTVLSMFTCLRIDPVDGGYHNAKAAWGHGYWVPDMSLLCFTGWHLRVALGLGLPLIVLTWVVIPLLPILLLFSRRNELHKSQVQLQLGYIYQCYKPKLWYWGSASLFLTLALAVAQVFATTLDPYFQVAIMLVILICGLTLLAQLQPFLDPLAQCMQVVSLFVVTLTAAGCLYFLDSDAVAKTSGLDAAGILLVLMNLAYASVMVILISVTARHKAVQFVRKLHIRALVCVQRTTAAASQFPGRVRLLKQSSSKYLLTQKPHASNLQRGGTDDLHANKLASKVSLQRLLALSNSFRVHRSLSSNSGTAGQPSSITKDVGDDDIT